MENQSAYLGKEASELSPHISEPDFEDLLITLDLMFEGDFTDENSKAYKKAQLAFKHLRMYKCTVEQFHEVMTHFERFWENGYWMPANIIRIWRDKFIVDEGCH